MAAGKEMNPTEYIGHHLTFAAKPIGDGGFWTLHIDTLATSIMLGVIGFGLMWLIPLALITLLGLSIAALIKYLRAA